MRDYELMVVLDANLDESGVEAVRNRVIALATQRGGSVEGVDVWGRRRLAYPIGRHRDGTYLVFRLRVSPGDTNEIERALKLSEHVLRHLLVRAEEAQPAAPARA